MAMSEMARDRMLKAEVRKEKLQKEKLIAISSSQKNHSPPESPFTMDDITTKLDSAAKRRDIFLAARSSSSKRMHSPREQTGSLTMDDIMTKLNSAAERREIYLKNKVKTSPRSSGDNVSKNLSFSSVSPSVSPAGAHSPRIKAARLESKSNDDLGPLPYFTPWLLSSFAIALLGIMTIARFSSSK